MENEWMSPREVAEYLGIALSSVYRYTDQGILKRYKLGNVARYKRSEVDQALKPNHEKD